VIVKDTQPGTGDSQPYYLTAAGGALYFSLFGADGTELWRSDGTAGGTGVIEDIRTGAGGSYPGDLTTVGGALYLTAFDDTEQRQLWKSDGTVAGTFPLTGGVTDTTPPETTIDSGPAAGSTITTSSATFTFSGTPGDTAKLQCRLDGGAFADCTSPRTFTGLGNGSHTVGFRAVDAEGNPDPTPAQRTFTVDSGSPVNTFTAPRTGKANTRKGTLQLTVTLPGAGTLTLGPSGRSPVKAASTHLSGAGTATITIKLTKDGKKLIKQKRNGRLKVKVVLTFTPTGGIPNAQTKRYTLIVK
jgi:ELWxxDGT repeat protein